MDARTDATVIVGPITIRIVSDVEDFPALSHFSTAAREARPRRPADFELYCMSPGNPAAGTLIARGHDPTARAKGFAKGYYVTDHFGSPVLVSTTGRRVCLVGDRLENLVWPYFVKYFLLLHSVAAGSLFLKSAAVSFDGAGTLVLGRGGAGKTVFISQLCRNGASFVTNSHAVLHDQKIHGVASTMRMRPGPWLDALDTHSPPALDRAEVLVDPFETFSRTDSVVTASTICVIDFQGPDRHVIEELSATETYDCLEQFGLGLNVYRLEEDLLDFVGGDYLRMAAAYRAMKERLRELADRCRGYYVQTDLMQTSYRNEVIGLLQSADRHSDRRGPA